ncbi:MAG: hypothetical protein MRJ68_14320 [Nitrospira sp.]|nr:hypothetical protein [Nitrospira sp.]
MATRWVVGARFEDSATTGINGNQADNSAPDSGAVYVGAHPHRRSLEPAGLCEGCQLEAGDEFGFWVDLAASTLAAGAPFEDSAATGINGNQADNSARTAERSMCSPAPESEPAGLCKGWQYGLDYRFGSHVAVDGDTLARWGSW